MKTLFAFLVWIFCCTSAFATAQTSDRIVVDGKEYYLFGNPMEEYFEKYPDKRPEIKVQSTGLWRGYVATLQVKGNELYVIDIEIEKGRGRMTAYKSVFSKVFPKQESVKMNWFTGLLVIPTGEEIDDEYGRSAFWGIEAGTYERYMVLAVENGIITGKREYSTDEYHDFNRRQFEAFKKSDEYKKIRYELEERYDSCSDKDFLNYLLQSLVMEHTTKFLVE
jgi:hypothetical protein